MPMRGFAPIVQPLVAAVIDTGTSLTNGNIVTARFVGYADARAAYLAEIAPRSHRIETDETATLRLNP